MPSYRLEWVRQDGTTSSWGEDLADDEAAALRAAEVYDQAHPGHAQAVREELHREREGRPSSEKSS